MNTLQNKPTEQEKAELPQAKKTWTPPHLMNVSINETSGSFASNPEVGGLSTPS